jgi:FKBP-type peptidyl-prolyl cis-trans isomerase
MRTTAAFLILLSFAFPLFAAQEKPEPPADLTAPPADAERSESGLITKRLAEGTGTAKLGETDIPRVRYTVWKSDGTLVQHVRAGQSLMISQKNMLPGWAEAVRQMVVGESRRAWVPASLASGKIGEGEMLVFDTELVEIVAQPTTPEDVAAPPADATVTESGLAYKVLRPGTGTEKPTRRSTVTVHYSGWTTDGKMFDSSVLRGQLATFPLNGVIAGWVEGLPLMTKGEKTRFWIPSKLAYRNEAGKPKGMLVFDIDLVDFR